MVGLKQLTFSRVPECAYMGVCAYEHVGVWVHVEGMQMCVCACICEHVQVSVLCVSVCFLGVYACVWVCIVCGGMCCFTLFINPSPPFIGIV